MTQQWIGRGVLKIKGEKKVIEYGDDVPKEKLAKDDYERLVKDGSIGDIKADIKKEIKKKGAK